MTRNPVEILAQSGMPEVTLCQHPGLFSNNFTIARFLFLHELYRLIVPVHGSIVEFGVRWGQDLAWLINLRGIYEPFNFRPIIGFDTWTGFPSVGPQDGKHAVGELGVPAGYEQSLAEVLAWHEGQIYPEGQFCELVKGDACQTAKGYMDAHPETVVALAYFDIDLYEPTKACLEAIMPRLTKGSVLAFDEVNCVEWPGETAALREVLGLGRFALRRSPQSRTMCYCVVE